MISGLLPDQIRLNLPNPRSTLRFTFPAHTEYIRQFYQRQSDLLSDYPEFQEAYMTELHTRRSIVLRNPPSYVVPMESRRGVVFRTRDFPFIPITQLKYIEPSPKMLDVPSAVAIGPIIQSQPTIVNYRSFGNHLRGLVKRVAHQQQYDKNLHQSFQQFTENWVKSNYQPLPRIDINHDNLDKLWLDNNGDYTLVQKEHYHHLLDEFLDSDTNINAFIKDHSDKLYLCNSFIKREFYAEEKEARIINGRPDLFKAIVAPFIKEIEHQVIYNKHFIKGKEPEDVANRLREIHDRYNFVYETDYSSFEGSFSAHFMKRCEWILLHYMLQNNPEILELIRPIYFSHSRILLSTSRKFKTHATFKGSRMSGDMWTSLCNGFSNMMILLFVIRQSCDRREWRSLDFDFIVEGDDGFFGTNKEINLDIVRRLGFTLKICGSTDLNETSFCGIHPTANAFMADFWRLIEKLGWSHDESVIINYTTTSTKRERELVRAKALSLLAFGKGNPILQPLAVKLLELTSDVNIRYRDLDWWERHTFDMFSENIRPVEILPESREYYQHYYHIPIPQQLWLEDFIKSQTSVRFIIPIDRTTVL